MADPFERTDEHVENRILRPQDALGHTLFERIEEEVSFETYMSEYVEDPGADQSGAMLRDFEEFVAEHYAIEAGPGLDVGGYEVVGLAIADGSGMVILINTQGMS